MDDKQAGEATAAVSDDLARELDAEIARLWAEAQRAGSSVRRQAEENGIDVIGLAEQLTSANALTPIRVTSGSAGFQPVSGALVVAFAPVAAEMVREVWRVVFLPRLHAKLSQTMLPPDWGQPQARPGTESVVRDQLVQGVVHEMVDDDAIVILDDGTETERRVMSRERLRAAGVCREGDSFDIRIREIKLSNPKGVHVESDIMARTGPWVVEPIRPGLDASKFRTPA